MSGDDAIRFCGRCQQNVYDVTELSSAQVEALLGTKACLTFYQRKDGTLVTRDCPEGIALRRRRAVRHALVATSIASAIGAAVAGMQETRRIAPAPPAGADPAVATSPYATEAYEEDLAGNNELIRIKGESVRQNDEPY